MADWYEMSDGNLVDLDAVSCMVKVKQNDREGFVLGLGGTMSIAVPDKDLVAVRERFRLQMRVVRASAEIEAAIRHEIHDPDGNLRTGLAQLDEFRAISERFIESHREPQ